MPLTMLELKQLELKQAFGNLKTIKQLQALTSPELNYNTIVNAINRGRVLAFKAGGDEQGGGIWLIDLPSAMNRWPKRFKKESK